MAVTGAVFLSCTKEKQADAVSSASIVDNPAGFLKAAGSSGTWIIAITQDLTIDKEIILEGEFENRGGDGRKIALYEQDENRKVTERYTLKAPRLTVRSKNARIQGGTFIGDIYVEADNFLIIDAKVEGDIYFKNESYKSTFKQEENGEVTGRIIVQ